MRRKQAWKRQRNDKTEKINRKQKIKYVGIKLHTPK